MTETSDYDLKWSSALPASPNSSDNKECPQVDYPKPFQLFGPWSPYMAPQLNTPVSPVPDHASSRLNPQSTSFAPFHVLSASLEFNPFAQEDADSDDALALSERFLTTNFLEDIEKEEAQTPTTHTTEASDSIFSSWIPWQPTVSPLVGNQTLRNIWEQPRFRDENEFDPTLHYYHRSLYDQDTIQDMSSLSLSVTNPSMEEAQAENVGENMSPLQMLETIFTDISKDDLRKILEQHEYDLDQAMEVLLNRKSPDLSQTLSKLQAPNTTIMWNPAQTHVQTPRKRQVCRHFLAGECYRKDCWFSHDLQVKVCKFWLQGSCLKGDYCEFLHYIDIQEMTNRIAPMNQIKEHPLQPTQFDETEYPGLQSKHAKQPLKPCPVQQSPTAPSAVLTPEDFPTLTSAVQMRPTAGKGPMPISFADVAKRMKTHPQKKTATTTLRSHEHQQLQRLKKPVRVPWLETGSKLNQEYLTQRAKAIEFGMLRNRFFNRATQYYLKGDGAKARAYSNEAQYYNRMMQEMHSEASRKIFEQRNKHEAFIDLHGLHVDEALDIIEEHLNKLKDYDGVVYIVTGSGHHSGMGSYSKKQSKLKPRVEEFLNQGNYRYVETNIMGDTMGGIFAVDLSLRQFKK